MNMNGQKTIVHAISSSLFKNGSFFIRPQTMEKRMPRMKYATTDKKTQSGGPHMPKWLVKYSIMVVVPVLVFVPCVGGGAALDKVLLVICDLIVAHVEDGLGIHVKRPVEFVLANPKPSPPKA
jgi:hypothetical protein